MDENKEDSTAEGEEKKEEPADNDNPYAYLDRDFSSEKHKVEIKNMPKFYGMSVCTVEQLPKVLLFI